MMQWEPYWWFETANLKVVFEITQCPDDPADHFDHVEEIDDIRNEIGAWFNCRVRVIKNHKVIGSDYLHGCHYNNVDEFISSHRDIDDMNRNCSIMRAAKGENAAICHYFPDMVLTAIADARKTLAL